MNKFIVLSMASALSASILATPVLSQEIVVARDPAGFISEVSADLDRQIYRASRSELREPGSGFAVVRFECADDGKPAKITLVRRTGDRAIGRIAVRAVKRLSSLHPLPSGVTDGQLFQANIVFAGDRREHARLSRKLAREEAARVASSRAERAVLAFNMAKTPNS